MNLCNCLQINTAFSGAFDLQIVVPNSLTSNAFPVVRIVLSLTVRATCSFEENQRQEDAIGNLWNPSAMMKAAPVNE